jgi:shikimate 5-dehydrogenase
LTLPTEIFREAVVLEAEYKHPVLADVPCRAYLGGRRWLLWQAVAGYELFTGEQPDVKKMSAVL